LLGVGLPPGRVVAAVGQFEVAGDLVVAVGQPGQLVQRIGGAALPTARRAGEHQASDAPGVAHGELLGHHAPERDAHDQGVLPGQRVEETGGIVGVVGHGIGAGGHRRLTQAALVVGGDLELLHQRPVEHTGRSP
jgi:hypothetical protein